MKTSKITAIFALVLLAAPVLADSHDPDEVVVTPTMAFPADGQWKHAFDAVEGEAGKANASLSRALGFYKHMETAGVGADQVKSAVVVHGPAIYDVANAARYAKEYGETASNPNAQIVSELLQRGGEIWVCGVAARYRGVGDKDLLPGVQIAPAAMVAHADLHRRGFSINPY
jgi:intracellular sulfur oxidation DsrE/DsrF family protein